MGQREKRVRLWLTDPPTDAPFSEVEALLNYYFKDKIYKKSGSHCVVRDERLIGHAGFDPYGEFVISKKGGRRVLGYQLQRLAQAIQILLDAEGDSHERP